MPQRDSIPWPANARTRAAPAPHRKFAVTFGSALLAFIFTLHARGQGTCDPRWLPGSGVPGVDGKVRAIAVRESCQSDRALQVFVGGDFTAAGTALANNIAAYDPAAEAWTALSTGISGTVRALAVLPDGDLVAGGLFDSAGGVAVKSIARWNGLTWSPLGTGVDGAVYALAVLPNGDLVAGGSFEHAGGQRVDNVARWNGSSWFAVKLGLDGHVFALAALPNGDFVAAGYFFVNGGTQFVGNIARWDGSSWSSLGNGLADGFVRALAILPNGDLVAGGNFFGGGSQLVGNIARWDGSSWSALGTGLEGASASVESLLALPNGELAVGGEFERAGGVQVGNAALWNGRSWSALGSGMNGDVLALAVLPSGSLLAGGDFYYVGSTAADSIARWDGSSWTALGPGINSNVNAIAVLPNGDQVVGGWFTTAGGAPANRIARWNGSSWSALGTGMNYPVNSLVVLPNGQVVAGGQFTAAGGVLANSIARWNGSTWSALGTGMDDQVLALAVMPNGDLMAGGSFLVAGGRPANRIARWNGSAWSTLQQGMDGSVFALAVAPNGDLVAGGYFSTAGTVAASSVARWDGSSWSALGPGITGEVRAVVFLPDGDLVVSGGFLTAGGLPASSIARWDGTAWTALGSGVNAYATALAALPNGDVVAGGGFTFAGGIRVNFVARSNGSAWTALGSGVTGHNGVSALALLPDGDLVVGGNFTTAGGNVSASFARYTGLLSGPKYYVGPDGGNWNGAANWSSTDGGPGGAGVPLNSDTVFITGLDSTGIHPKTITFDLDYITPGINSLTIAGASGGTTQTLNQDGHTLRICGDEFLGLTGPGAHIQSGTSLNEIGGTLNIGPSGTYDLQAGSLSATNIVNNGTFNIGTGATLNVAGGVVSSDDPSKVIVLSGTPTLIGGTIAANLRAVAGTAIAKAEDAALTISAPQTYEQNSSFLPRAGVTTFTKPTATTPQAANLSLQFDTVCGARVEVALEGPVRSTYLKNLNISTPGELSLTAGTNETLVSKALAINIANDSQSYFDIGDNAFILRPDENFDHGAARAADVASYIASGRKGKGGSWTGTGIFSRAAAARATPLSRARAAAGPQTAVGMLNNDDGFGTPVYPSPDFRGVPIDLNSIIVWYTIEGDNNLDGAVDIADLNLWLQGFQGLHGPAPCPAPHNGPGAAAPAANPWYFGDYNYDGCVDLADLTLLAKAYYAIHGDVNALLDAINASVLEDPLKSMALDAVCTARGCISGGGRLCKSNTLDVTSFLTLWFAKDPKADFNNSGAVSIQDLFDFLSAWFSRCL